MYTVSLAPENAGTVTSRDSSSGPGTSTNFNYFPGTSPGVVDLALNQAAKPWFNQYLDPAWYHLWLCLFPNMLFGDRSAKKKIWCKQFHMFQCFLVSQDLHVLRIFLIKNSTCLSMNSSINQSINLGKFSYNS